MSIRFGIISDPQYSDIDDMKGREYRKSLDKLRKAIATLNSEELDFVVQLGDLIDHEFESYAPVLEVWKGLKHKSFHVLGNHDYCVRTPHKQEVLKTLSMKEAYYSTSINDVHFIFLNGNGLSLNAYDAGSEMYNYSEKYWESIDTESQWWNGAIESEQLSWLKEELDICESKNIKAILFCHYPLSGDERYTLWNRSEVIDLLEKYECVKVWMNGHYHAGAYSMTKKIHFLTVKGMVQHKLPTYALGEVKQSSLHIKGFGEEESRILNF